MTKDLYQNTFNRENYQEKCQLDSPTRFSIDPYGWHQIPYPNEYLYPQGEEVMAQTWKMSYFTRKSDNFIGPDGSPLNFPIKEADMVFNFKKEFEFIANLSKFLTPKQIELAKYWGYGPPVKQFLPIADILITTYKVPACRAQRIFYILNAALNDSCVVCWHFKYKYKVIRPVQYNPCFEPVLATPRHPSYPAGHSVMAGCMAAVLSYFFPAEKEKIYHLGNECSFSRLYAGVHYKADCDEGFLLGEFIGNKIMEIETKEVNGNNAQIDYQYIEFKDAPIYPDTSEQYI